MNELVVEPDTEIQRLEWLTNEVVQALTEMRTSDVQTLVVRQCECMQKITKAPLELADTQRMGRIAEMVQRQQALIEQAVQTADYFMRTLGAKVSYNEVG